MKTVDILYCARPVLFETNYDGFEYSIGGTAFIVRFYKKIYIVTAKHVLNVKHFSLDQFRVQYHPNGKDFIPITDLYTLKKTDDEDTDQFDLAIFEVEHINLNEDLFLNHQPYNLLEIDKFTVFNPNSAFIYRGFPIELRPIDWEMKKICHSAFLGHAKYLEKTASTGMHKLELLHSE